MNKEVQSIIQNLQRVNTGTPWYGRAVYEILDEVDPAKATIKPNQSGHSLLDLLYHMLTWAEFTLHRIEGGKEDMASFEELDWRAIAPSKHTWKKGMATFKLTHDKIIKLLETKEDSFLKGIVDYREYNFRFC